MTRYRIKKVGRPTGQNKTKYRYFFQYNLGWWPFWHTLTWEEKYEEARKRMEDYVSVAKRKTTVSHIYHTEAEPEHLPKEQIDRFHEEKNRKELGGNV